MTNRNVVVALEICASVAADGHVMQTTNVRTRFVTYRCGLIALNISSSSSADGYVVIPITCFDTIRIETGTHTQGNATDRACVGTFTSSQGVAADCLSTANGNA